MSREEETAERIYNSMKGVRVRNSHRKKCAITAATLVLEEIKNVTGHCTLNNLDRSEVELDKEFWEEVIEILKNK